MKQHPKSAGWLVKCALSAALVLAACAIATARLSHPPQLQTTTRDSALFIANRYVDNPVPDIVMVGSSIAYRLREEYFATPRLRNLALPGGSGLTGLEIIARQPQLPKLIVVETNVLSRQTDMELVERAVTRASNDAWFFLPVRTAIAAYENWRHGPVTHAQFEPTLRRLLNQPPSDFDNRAYLEVAVQQMEADDPSPTVKANVDALRKLIDALENRGARVLLMDVPYADQIEVSHHARKTREIVHGAFPDADRWLPIEVQRAELRWNDGVHLDERSAVIVSRYLDERVFSRVVYPPFSAGR